MRLLGNEIKTEKTRLLNDKLIGDFGKEVKLSEELIISYYDKKEADGFAIIIGHVLEKGKKKFLITINDSSNELRIIEKFKIKEKKDHLIINGKRFIITKDFYSSELGREAILIEESIKRVGKELFKRILKRFASSFEMKGELAPFIKKIKKDYYLLLKQPDKIYGLAIGITGNVYEMMTGFIGGITKLYVFIKKGNSYEISWIGHDCKGAIYEIREKEKGQVEVGETKDVNMGINAINTWQRSWQGEPEYFKIKEFYIEALSKIEVKEGLEYMKEAAKTILKNRLEIYQTTSKGYNAFLKSLKDITKEGWNKLITEVIEERQADEIITGLINLKATKTLARLARDKPGLFASEHVTGLINLKATGTLIELARKKPALAKECITGLINLKTTWALKELAYKKTGLFTSEHVTELITIKATGALNELAYKKPGLFKDLSESNKEELKRLGISF